MAFDYENEKQDSQQKIAEAADEKQLEALRVEYLGKKGKVAAMYSNLATLSNDEKPEAGKKINELRNVVTQLIEEKKKALTAQKRQASQETLDVTIPGVAPSVGHAHILTQTIGECSFGQPNEEKPVAQLTATPASGQAQVLLEWDNY